MNQPAKPLIDAWTLEQAQAAAAADVPESAAVVEAALAANAGRVEAAASALRLAMPRCEDIRLLFLGFQFFFRTGDHATAETLTQRRLEIAERAGETEHVARACTNLGLIHLATGRLDSAHSLCDRALTIDQRLGNQQGVARDLGNLANVYEARKEFDTAERLNHRSLAIAREIGDVGMNAGKLANLGDIAAATGRPELARDLWSEAAALFELAGDHAAAATFRSRERMIPQPASVPHRAPDEISLRRTRHTDLPLLFSFETDRAANDLVGTKPRDWQSFQLRWMTILSDHDGTVTGVVPRVIEAAGVVVGSVNVSPHEGRDSLGYWISREYWGRGIATRAVALMLEELARRPLYATAAAHNLPSLRVLQKNGFEVIDRAFSPPTSRTVERETVTLVLR
jgi:RimJ/RimL family protein N-acetyltransferase